MTESEWAASSDPVAMLKWLEETGGESSNRPRNPPSERKLRLFATAMWRAHPAILAKHGAQSGLPDICERMADGLATEEEIAEARAKHGLDLDGGTLPYARYVRQAASHLASVLLRGPECVPEKRRQAHLLRDIVGTPHRPVKLPPGPACGGCKGEGGFCVAMADGYGGDYKTEWATCRACQGRKLQPCPWLTPTVVGLAHAAYEERDPETGHLDPVRLAVLADALEEAGCDSEPLLRHLRGWRRCRACAREGGRHASACVCKPTGGWLPNESPHVRGCWAVDAVLGRE